MCLQKVLWCARGKSYDLSGNLRMGRWRYGCGCWETRDCIVRYTYRVMAFFNVLDARSGAFIALYSSLLESSFIPYLRDTHRKPSTCLRFRRQPLQLAWPSL
jgi:hypothetical protein